MAQQAKYTSESQQQIQLVHKYPSVRTVFKASQKFLTVAIICTILVFSIVVTPAQAKEAYISREADLAQMPIEQPYIRKEAHSPEAQEDIKSLKNALDRMRNMPCGNPLSWYYQGAIHWVPTGDKEIKYLDGTYKICPSYNKVNHKLQKAWDDCAHFDMLVPEYKKYSQDLAQRNFLVWHRLYVYHFENIVRALSGDENFALPYWRYINLNSTNDNPGNIDLTMPGAFRVGDAKNNSLFEEGRFSKLKQGEKIENKFVDDILVKGAVDINNNSSFQDFSKKLENSIHNQMHNYIGTGLPTPHADQKNKFNQIFNGVFNGANDGVGTGLMTEVQSAGFDPIFWMHHGNIDRLWDQWTNESKTYVTLQDLCENSECKNGQHNLEYKFFDPEVLPDGTITSKEVNYSLTEAIDKIYKLGYRYDDTPMVPPPLPKQKRLLAEVRQASKSPTPLAIQEVGKVVSSNRSVDLQLPMKPQMETELRRLRTANSTEQVTKGYTLDIDVTYTGRPYSSYDVFLNLPNRESKNDIDTYFAGSISFFVLPSAKPVTKTFQFDITDELVLQLEKQGEEINNKLSVLIEKATGPEDESLKIERISLKSY